MIPKQVLNPTDDICQYEKCLEQTESLNPLEETL